MNTDDSADAEAADRFAAVLPPGCAPCVRRGSSSFRGVSPATTNDPVSVVNDPVETVYG